MKEKYNACKLQIFFKMPCKKDDFPKARSRMLMKPFLRTRSRLWDLRRYIYVEFYSNIIDINKSNLWTK